MLIGAAKESKHLSVIDLCQRFELSRKSSATT